MKVSTELAHFPDANLDEPMFTTYYEVKEQDLARKAEAAAIKGAKLLSELPEQWHTAMSHKDNENYMPQAILYAWHIIKQGIMPHPIPCAEELRAIAEVGLCFASDQWAHLKVIWVLQLVHIKIYEYDGLETMAISW